MLLFPLTIVTPIGTALKSEAVSITVPGADGEVTILARHQPLFSLLTEGVVTVRLKDEEKYFSIGGGYVETSGKDTTLLVSRAYGQDEIDEKEVETARARAEKLVTEAKTEEERQQALSSLRRSVIDLKLVGKIKKYKRTTNIS